MRFIYTIFLILSFQFANASSKFDIIFADSMTDITVDKNGSYSQLSTIINDTRENNPNTIFLFGGDSLGPSAMSSLDKGSHLIDILNSLEPDAMSLDKREFSFFEDEISLRSYEAAFPMVLSNIYDTFTNDNIDGIKDYVLIKKGNINFGIISVINRNVIEEYALKRVQIKDIEKSIREKSSKLKELGAELIILLPSNAFPIVDKLLNEGIVDLSLSKNEHFNLTQNKRVSTNNRNILITNKYDVSKVSFILKDKTIQSFKNEFIMLNKQKKDPIVEAQIQDYTNRLDLLLNEKIGIFKNEVDTTRKVVRGKESSFGNLFADSLKAYTNADLTIINGGTIRGETLYEKEHKITRRDISKELPYRNKVVLLQIKGSQIYEALENGFSLVENLKGRFPQVSGIKVEYDLSNKVGERVKKVYIDNRPLDRDQNYRVSTTSYLASGGDGYKVFEKAKKLKFDNPVHRLASDILVDYIKKKREIFSTVDGRLKEINAIGK